MRNSMNSTRILTTTEKTYHWYLVAAGAMIVIVGAVILANLGNSPTFSTLNDNDKDWIIDSLHQEITIPNDIIKDARLRISKCIPMESLR